LTSFVYANSPAGEGNSPTKAYAAAFVLLVIVILMNFVVDLFSRQRNDPWAR
jgi:phosphate transport system permease protein